MVQKALRVWLIQSHTPETSIFQEVLKMITDFFKQKRSCRRIESWVSDICKYVKSRISTNVEIWGKCVLRVGWQVIAQTVLVLFKNLKFIYHTLVFDELNSSFSKFYLNLSLDFLRWLSLILKTTIIQLI